MKSWAEGAPVILGNPHGVVVEVPLAWGLSGSAANMGRMGSGERNKAWAQRMVAAAGGRPVRMVVYSLLVDEPIDHFKTLGREEQERRLAPFLLDGERFHCGNDGEIHIVPIATGGRATGPDHDRPLDELKEAAKVQAHWAVAAASLKREAWLEAWSTATADMAADYVQLERTVLEKALNPNATVQERKLAMQAWNDWKDRRMGKAVSPTEDVTAGRTADPTAFLAVDAPLTLPASASWTPESVAQDQLRELEAGTLEGEEV